MSEVNSKDALKEQAKLLRKIAEGVKGMGETLTLLAGGLSASADSLVLLAAGSDTASDAAPATPPAATGPKRRGPGRAAATETATVTLDEAREKFMELYKSDTKEGPVQCEAILQRHGLKKISEAKPDVLKKIFDASVASLAGDDATASKPSSMFD